MNEGEREDGRHQLPAEICAPGKVARSQASAEELLAALKLSRGQSVGLFPHVHFVIFTMNMPSNMKTEKVL